jgi:hypothetical protein
MLGHPNIEAAPVAVVAVVLAAKIGGVPELLREGADLTAAQKQALLKYLAPRDPNDMPPLAYRGWWQRPISGQASGPGSLLEYRSRSKDPPHRCLNGGVQGSPESFHSGHAMPADADAGSPE